MVNDQVIRRFLKQNSIDDMSKYLLIDAGSGDFIATWDYDIDEPTSGEADTIYNEILFDIFKSDINFYRDSVIKKGIVTHESVSSYTDEQSKSALTGYLIGYLNNPTNNITVHWTFQDTTSDIEIDTVQGLQEKIITFQNRVYSAANATISEHATNPFPDMASAYEFFDDLMR